MVTDAGDVIEHRGRTTSKSVVAGSFDQTDIWVIKRLKTLPAESVTPALISVDVFMQTDAWSLLRAWVTKSVFGNAWQRCSRSPQWRVRRYLPGGQPIRRIRRELRPNLQMIGSS